MKKKIQQHDNKSLITYENDENQKKHEKQHAKYFKLLKYITKWDYFWIG